MRFPSLLIIITLLVSCGRYFPPDRNLKRHVQKSEVVGIWSMRPSSLEILERDGYVLEPSAKHTLVFRGDDSLTFESAYPEIDEIEHISSEGTWSLTHHDDGSTTLDVNIRLNGAEHSEDFSFAEEGGSLILWQQFGDPDMWEFIEYTKNKES